MCLRQLCAVGGRDGLVPRGRECRSRRSEVVLCRGDSREATRNRISDRGATQVRKIRWRERAEENLRPIEKKAGLKNHGFVSCRGGRCVVLRASSPRPPVLPPLPSLYLTSLALFASVLPRGYVAELHAPRSLALLHHEARAFLFSNAS